MASPLEPLGLFACQFIGGKRHHLTDVTGGGDAATTIYGSYFQDQRVTVAEVAYYLTVVVGAIHGRGTHADRVVPAVRNAALPLKRKKSDVSTPVVPAVEIRIGGLRNKAEPVHAEKLGQPLGAFSVEIERRLLCIGSSLGLGFEVRRPVNCGLSRRKIFL